MSQYHLTSKLAQKIVDKTMEILDCNINIINKKGQIIGSGDNRRLGELHEGALLALSQKRIVVIDEASTKNLHGVRPGVNLPMQIEGEIVGVIGLTGDPEYLKPFGQLVCMSAQMMLEQEKLLHDLAHETRLREELVLKLIHNESLDEKLVEWGQRLNIDLAIPYVVFVVELDASSEIISAIDGFKYMQDYLTQHEITNLYAMQSLSEMVVLVPALNHYGRWDLEKYKKILQQLIEKTNYSGGPKFKTALGKYFENEDNNISKSYQTAHTAMVIGKQRKPLENHYYYQDMVLPVLLNRLSDCWQTSEFFIPLDRLKKKDTKGLLIKTLRVWFKKNLQMGDTANTLHIHRNTLEYRLNKVSAITGLNMAMLDDRLLLYIAIILDHEN